MDELKNERKSRRAGGCAVMRNVQHLGRDLRLFDPA